MKSVGEVMAIGRSFEEAIQKGMRMIGRGAHGFVANKEMHVEDIDRELKEPTDSRIFVISKAFEAGYTVGKYMRRQKSIHGSWTDCTTFTA